MHLIIRFGNHSWNVTMHIFTGFYRWFRLLKEPSNNPLARTRPWHLALNTPPGALYSEALFAFAIGLVLAFIYNNLVTPSLPPCWVMVAWSVLCFTVS